MSRNMKSSGMRRSFDVRGAFVGLKGFAECWRMREITTHLHCRGELLVRHSQDFRRAKDQGDGVTGEEH